MGTQRARSALTNVKSSPSETFGYETSWATVRRTASDVSMGTAKSERSMENDVALSAPKWRWCVIAMWQWPPTSGATIRSM